jgi:cytochrome o ubiquinol oxidase subunit 2
VLLSPSGDVALQQRNILLTSTALMLIIILPVLVLTCVFAWHYRAANTQAKYDPKFHHSTGLEVVIWSMPLLIIIMLGAITWLTTHLLDPYRPIGRTSAAKPITEGRASGREEMVKPITVQVVALDWKWLFFYPEQGIATVNELAAPVDVPIVFKITSQAVMNSFFIPTLAGQIYAMPGMQTTLHAVINKPGIYDGLSAHYSGAGFSKMTFKFHGLDPAQFDAWVAKVKAEGEPLDRARYLKLEDPSEGEPVRYFSSTEPGLYDAILNMCTRPGKMCMSEMMMTDRRGGGGKDSREAVERLRYDSLRRDEGKEAPGATVPGSGQPAKAESHGGADAARPSRADPHAGHGGAPPGGGQGPAPTQLTR